MRFYVAHGLTFASELVLPGLVSVSETRPDVEVRLHAGDLNIPSHVIASGDDYAITKEGTFIYPDKRFNLLIRDGGEILVHPRQGADIAEIGAPVKWLLGTLLFQRGRFVIHSSAVAIQGYAVAFVGDQEQGKSSLAFALYHRGYQFVADDVLSFERSNSAWLAFPAFPEARVPINTLAALSIDEGLGSDKPPSQRLSLTMARFAAAPLPLRIIYVLSKGETTLISTLSSRDAFVELVTHSRRAELSERAETLRHLKQCAQLVQAVSVRRLQVHRASTDISKVARLVEEDVLSTSR